MKPDFILDYLPFWIVTYAAALTGWACLARFLMQAFLPIDSPNYIWRGFLLLTNWAVAVAARLVPSFVTGFYLPLVAAYWLFVFRMIFGLLMLGAGLAPSISPPQQG
jgi:hypothetical protein